MTNGFLTFIICLTYAGGLGTGILIGWLEWGQKLARRRSSITSIPG